MIAAIDRAMHAHMGHGAMACGDPLTECLCDELAPPPELPQDGAARPADAPAAPSWGMWDIERQHPWRWALAYGAVFVASIVGAHGTAAGWW